MFTCTIIGTASDTLFPVVLQVVQKTTKDHAQDLMRVFLCPFLLMMRLWGGNAGRGLRAFHSPLASAPHSGVVSYFMLFSHKTNTTSNTNQRQDHLIPVSRTNSNMSCRVYKEHERPEQGKPASFPAVPQVVSSFCDPSSDPSLAAAPIATRNHADS